VGEVYGENLVGCFSITWLKGAPSHQLPYSPQPKKGVGETQFLPAEILGTLRYRKEGKRTLPPVAR